MYSLKEAVLANVESLKDIKKFLEENQELVEKAKVFYFNWDQIKYGNSNRIIRARWMEFESIEEDGLYFYDGDSYRVTIPIDYLVDEEYRINAHKEFEDTNKRLTNAEKKALKEAEEAKEKFERDELKRLQEKYVK